MKDEKECLENDLAFLYRAYRRDRFFLLSMNERDFQETFCIPEELRFHRGLAVDWLLSEVYDENIRKIEEKLKYFLREEKKKLF